MLFKLDADAVFEARDIDDALDKLGTYLIKGARGIEQKTIFTKGTIKIQKVKMENNHDNKLVSNCNG